MRSWLKQYWFEVILVVILYTVAPYFGMFVGLVMLVCWLMKKLPPGS